MPAVLTSLLDPVSPTEFREHYYGRKPLLVRGHPEKFRDLFTWEDLNRVLNGWPVPHPMLYLPTRTLGRIDASTPGSLLQGFRAGATMVMDMIHLFDPKVGRFTRALEAETGEPISTNLYLSQRREAAFDRHYDLHDIFVLQIYGHKAWSLYERTVDRPVYGLADQTGEKPDVPILECELAPGDTLYVPRGCWHEVVARGLSLHLTFGINARTGIDFLTWLTDELRGDVEFRRELPLSFDDEPAGVRADRLREHVSRLGTLISTRLNDPATLRKFHRHCVSCDRDATRFKLPAQLFDSPSTVLDVRDFSRSPLQRSMLEESGADELILTVWGRLFRYPRTARGLLEFILAETFFDYEAALSHAGELTEGEVRDVIDELLREGIIDAQGFRSPH